MLTLRLAAALLLLTGGTAPKLLTWPDLTSRVRPTPDATIPYGTDEFQKVDVWTPAGPGPHRTVLMVHGGCWQSAIADRSLMYWIADDLRRSGYAVWNIDYRGVDRPGGRFDGVFTDTGRAADLLRDHATRYRLDLSRVVAVGHSAGGHLAAWLAARPRLGRGRLTKPANPLPIAHVISLGGLPDLEQALRERQGCGNEPIDKLLLPFPIEDARVTRKQQREFLRDKSIPLMAPIGVPQTLINGDSDRIIPTRFAADYARKMRAAGDQVSVHVIPRQGHVELIAPESAAWAEARRAIAAAFRR
ncbi:MAG: alpha/beta hydrolase [Sphingomonas bacterium]|uniref:alpha/beta hydrolase n=1 Tax=Sphingomonas bacterium TaxID=1895847 RepID=UPI002601B4B2|nr:alpha/beta hydrolase [Sphingomonas bacterium]MDB5696041.1 alpha/beta hydrolase [Sphingomonas bacterium]